MNKTEDVTPGSQAASTTPDIANAYQHCASLARRHYENFPVASHWLPRKLRKPITAIYAFARTADDWADEGDWSNEQRLAALNAMEQSLQHITDHGEAGGTDPLFIALADSITRFTLPLKPLQDLLSAFRQDVEQKEYENFGAVMDYCRRSANPVGRLYLHLLQADSPRNIGYADAICSALQLINFLQDFHQDYLENRRIYFPRDEMLRFGVDAHLLEHRNHDPRLRRLIQFQCQRAWQLLQAGAPLGSLLKGRAGFEIRLIILGGHRILRQLQEQEDPFSRPRLKPSDRLSMLWGSLRQSLR